MKKAILGALLLLIVSGAGAQIKMSEMTAAGTLTGNELIAIVQGGATRRTTAQQIANLAPPGGDTTGKGLATRNNLRDTSAALRAAIAANTGDTTGKGLASRYYVQAYPTTPLWSNIGSKPSSFPPSAHTHAAADLTQSGAATGQALTWNGTAWVPTTLAAGTSYTGTGGVSVAGSVISLSGESYSTGEKAKLAAIAAGATANSSDATLLARANHTGTQGWGTISGAPTTLGGYGITDAFTQTLADALYAPLGHAHTFASLTSKPTTLAGYGITDAAALSHTHAYSSLTGLPTIPSIASTTNILKGNGSGSAVAAAPGTDYVIPSGSITGTASNVTGTVVLINGGTGLATATPYALFTGGTTSTGAMQQLGLGTTGQYLISNGTGALAGWQTSLKLDSVRKKASTDSVFEYRNGTPTYAYRDSVRLLETIIVEISDETTALTTGTGKRTFRMPWPGTIYNIRASLTTAGSGLSTIFNVKKNGTTIFSTNLSIDIGATTSVGATTPYVFSTTSFANNDVVSIDLTQAGVNAAGGKLYFDFIRQ